MVSITTKGLFAEACKTLTTICGLQVTSSDVGSLHLFGLVSEEDIPASPGVTTAYQPAGLYTDGYLPTKADVAEILPTSKTLPLPGNL